MKKVFKPLGIAAAVAAASAGFTNVASADPAVANNALGDLALVPYYTVNDDWITGIHIVNTSDATQVVKFRFRRAADSLDALDFNIVMSPQDVYAGTLRDDGDTIFWSAGDTTCTVPETEGGRLEMPAIYREGAETGYVEIIAMGQADEDMPISKAAVHTTDTLTPVSCEAVRSNFFANGVSGTSEGVIDNATTHQPTAGGVTGGDNTFVDSEDVLKVSYFIRDNATGVEFGDNAVHIAGFIDLPAITNQQFGFNAGDLNGFDFPDLNGIDPDNGPRGRFNLLRDPSVLGVGKLINEWTANVDNGAATDWVVTMPGQYLMLDIVTYIESLTSSTVTCPTGTLGSACDFRDIPVEASIVAYNREEFKGNKPQGNLVISPSPVVPGDVILLDKETNVITFGGQSVLGISDHDVSADLIQPFGWLSLAVTSQPGDQGVCIWDETQDAPAGSESAEAAENLTQTCEAASGNVPMIGFAAWNRNVAANPDASYGRIVAHSFSS